MDHHGIERVLDLVRDARGQLSERGELLRVRELRAETRELLHVARAHHHAGDAALVAQDLRAQRIDDRPLSVRDRSVDRPDGLVAFERLRNDLRHRMLFRKKIPEEFSLNLVSPETEKVRGALVQQQDAPLAADNQNGVREPPEHRRQPARVVLAGAPLVIEPLTHVCEKLRYAAHIRFALKIERWFAVHRLEAAELAAQQLDRSPKPIREKQRRKKSSDDSARRKQHVLRDHIPDLFFQEQSRDRDAHGAERLPVIAVEGHGHFENAVALPECPELRERVLRDEALERRCRRELVSELEGIAVDERKAVAIRHRDIHRRRGVADDAFGVIVQGRIPCQSRTELLRLVLTNHP